MCIPTAHQTVSVCMYVCTTSFLCLLTTDLPTSCLIVEKKTKKRKEEEIIVHHQSASCLCHRLVCLIKVWRTSCVGEGEDIFSWIR